MAGEQYNIGRLPYVAQGYGFVTPFGITLPPGGRVAAFLRSTGAQDYDDPSLARNLVTTLASALLKVRAGLGDTIVVLPGHSESVADNTMLDNLRAGTRIVGCGRGANMPVFRWTATGSQWILNDADVMISGLRLRMEGANGVVKAIAWSGADCALSGCDIEVASGAALKATIAIDIAAGGTRAEIFGNTFRGSDTHNVTDGVLVSGAADQVKICDNVMVASATAGNGLIRVSGAATNILIARNIITNTHTASTACIAIADVASSGMVADNRGSNLNNGTANAQGVVFAGVGTTTVKAAQNYFSDEPGKSGVLTPAVAT